MNLSLNCSVIRQKAVEYGQCDTASVFNTKINPTEILPNNMNLSLNCNVIRQKAVESVFNTTNVIREIMTTLDNYNDIMIYVFLCREIKLKLNS